MEIVDIGSWNELSAAMEKMESRNGVRWIFRGVTSADHGLVPKIGRNGARKDPADGSETSHCESEERKLLETFKRTARPFLQFHPECDLEWLAVAQHFGAPTRLLDWTESPLVAAYFALEASGTKGPPAIYALPAPREVPKAFESNPFAHLREVMTYYPPHISPRIQVQQSVFTYHPEPSIEYRPAALVQWRLPAFRPSFLLRQTVDRLGFNRAALFPDLQGLAEHLAWRYKWQSL